MEMIENRRFIRHPICLPLSFKVMTGADPASQPSERSSTVNISLGGLLFSSTCEVQPEASIVIDMPFEEKVFNVRAKVVRCVKNPETKLNEIAVRFTRLQEAFKVKMIEQIYLIAEYRNLLKLESGKEVSLEEASRLWIERYSARFSKMYW